MLKVSGVLDGNIRFLLAGAAIGIIFIVIAWLASVAVGAPSDAITKDATPGVLALSGTNNTVFESIEFYNPFVGEGHYNSTLQHEIQEEAYGIPTSLINFTEEA